MIRPERIAAVAQAVQAFSEQPFIARGSGLAYGDAAMNGDGAVIAMERINKLLTFDPVAGTIRCQAGACLGDVLSAVLPYGWFLSVTPGTARATVGGCIACDVHGKNHHEAGSFGNHILGISLLGADGEIRSCSPEELADLFWATVGGMGMTGIILDATIALRRVDTSWVIQRNVVTRDLDETLRVLCDTRNSTYSVAWLDATAVAKRLGRGVVMLGEHAARDQLPASVKIDPLAYPASRQLGVPACMPAALRGFCTARLLNELIYRRYAWRANKGEQAVPAAAFFYPLDGLNNWNRLYGRRGFIEYQVVIPENAATAIIQGILESLKQAHQPSFFTSIKRMGPGNAAPLSFPAEGIAFSVDVPVRDDLFDMLDAFDDKVAAAGGRVYLAKDARCRGDVLDAFYPRRREWESVVARCDPHRRLSSDMARRIGLRTAGHNTR